VVVTSTITALAADSPFGNGSSTAWRRRSGAIALILAGALVGAALLKWHLAAPMVLAGVLAAAVTAFGHVRREA
jgi:ferric-dicitrate binding protein FerR (iron transport regulator)